jgi:GNAT superfamily N-acetyltransferase
VDNFYVVPEARGKSTAFRLTMAVVQEAKRRGCGVFCAEIYKIDPLYDYILRLHRHFGMEPVEETEFKVTTAKSISGEPYARQPRIATPH